MKGISIKDSSIIYFYYNLNFQLLLEKLNFYLNLEEKILYSDTMYACLNYIFEKQNVIYFEI